MNEQDPQLNQPAEDADNNAAPAEGAGTVGRPSAKIPPHEENAPPDILNPRGKATITLLNRVADPYVIKSGGRDDIPWIEIKAQILVEVTRRCRDSKDLDLKMLHCLLVVDYIDYFQVLYILLSPNNGNRAMVKVNITPDDPTVPTVTSLWGSANWYEREMHDLFGVKFEGHPDLKPLILFEGFEGYPGRKSFPFHDYEEF